MFQLYDQKYFYFISDACYEIKMMKKNRKMWYKQLGKVDVPLYCINVVEFYNNNTKKAIHHINLEQNTDKIIV